MELLWITFNLSSFVFLYLRGVSTLLSTAVLLSVYNHRVTIIALSAFLLYVAFTLQDNAKFEFVLILVLWCLVRIIFLISLWWWEFTTSQQSYKFKLISYELPTKLILFILAILVSEFLCSFGLAWICWFWQSNWIVIVVQLFITNILLLLYLLVLVTKLIFI